MGRGKYRADEITLVSGEFAEPNIDAHGNLVVDATLPAETTKIIGTVNISQASIDALAAAIVAAQTP